MPDPVNNNNAVRTVPIIGHGETFNISPTKAERQKITAARAARAKQGHAFQRADNSRHRLVGFDYNKALLKPAHLKHIRSAVLKEAKSFNGKPRFWVCGYASRSGSAKGNLSLSMRRARAVAAYIKKLVPDAQVNVQAAGESTPYQKGAVDGSEDYMDRAVEIGVMAAGKGKAGYNDKVSKKIEQQRFMKKTFQRFAGEARTLALLKAIDFPNMQSLLQSVSRRNKTIVRNNVLQHILNRSWPIIHKEHPRLSVKEVITELKAWHQDLKKGS